MHVCMFVCKDCANVFLCSGCSVSTYGLDVRSCIVWRSGRKGIGMMELGWDRKGIGNECMS